MKETVSYEVKKTSFVKEGTSFTVTHRCPVYPRRERETVAAEIEGRLFDIFFGHEAKN